MIHRVSCHFQKHTCSDFTGFFLANDSDVACFNLAQSCFRIPKSTNLAPLDELLKLACGSDTHYAQNLAMDIYIRRLLIIPSAAERLVGHKCLVQMCSSSSQASQSCM